MPAISCKPASVTQADDACAAQTFSHYGLMLFRRPLTSDELQSRVKLAESMTKASGDFYTGLRYGLASLLQSSNFPSTRLVKICLELPACWPASGGP